MVNLEKEFFRKFSKARYSETIAKKISLATLLVIYGPGAWTLKRAYKNLRARLLERFFEPF